ALTGVGAGLFFELLAPALRSPGCGLQDTDGFWVGRVRRPSDDVSDRPAVEGGCVQVAADDRLGHPCPEVAVLHAHTGASTEGQRTRSQDCGERVCAA